MVKPPFEYNEIIRAYCATRDIAEQQRFNTSEYSRLVRAHLFWALSELGVYWRT
jgi:hypothetical protein